MYFKITCHWSFQATIPAFGSHNSILPTVTTLWAGTVHGWISRRHKKVFASAKSPDRLWNLPTLLSMGTGVKWPGNEPYNSPSPSVEVKYESSYTSTHLFAFMLCTWTALPISDLWYYFISMIKHKKKWLSWDLNWDDKLWRTS